MNSAQATRGTPASQQFLNNMNKKIIRGYDLVDVKEC
jgi:hypothetical protein